MTPRLRKFALTAHITASVGWLGAVAGFLVLAIGGLTSQDAQRVRAAYLAMELTAWFVIVPLSLASPLTGLIQSLGTTWGLFRHYWVVAKLLMTIPASIILLLHMQPISQVAGAAAETTLSSTDLRGLRIQLVANAGAALLVLFVTTTLSVYKPKGMTRVGRRKLLEHNSVTNIAELPADSESKRDIESEPGRGSVTRALRGMYVIGAILIALALLFIILHLTGGGLGRHTP